MSARIEPASPPFEADVQQWLDRTMPPGKQPLVLFATLARDTRLFSKFFAGGLLDRGHLTLRQREIVIARTTALCQSEYEWGVHIAIFGHKAHFDSTQIFSLAYGNAEDPCWVKDECVLLRLCGALHRECTVDDTLWQDLRAAHSEGAILELILLAGFYRTTSYLTNALRLPLEPDAARFPPHDTPNC
jgi:alkylhydroperoxidase family enzyme